MNKKESIAELKKNSETKNNIYVMFILPITGHNECFRATLINRELKGTKGKKYIRLKIMNIAL
ncbi:MAG: hypothetical protein PHV06_11735 [bacterium]|nr:hypothetical protein [bacterium]